MKPEVTAAQLRERAREIRRAAVTMIHEAGSGHPGGSLSAADLIAALYFKEMNLDPKDPKWPDRDRFVLSKGHVCPAQYAALAARGFFPEETLHTLRKEGSILQGHPDMKKCPGIDVSTGSLGQGLSVAAGMALAGKRDGKHYRVFCIVGDGEADEGQIWEAIMFAHAQKLDNIIDSNGLQIDGRCDDIIPHLDLTAKLAAFGFETWDIDGNDMDQILQALDEIRVSTSGKPRFINARTIKGKGVSYMENNAGWHGKAPNAEEYEIAMRDLEGAEQA